MPAEASRSSSLVLPSPYPSRPLQRDVDNLRPLQRLSSPLAVFQLPSHLALPLAHIAPALSFPLVWLNNRWTLADILQALRLTNARYIILPPSSSLPASLLPQLRQHLPAFTVLTITRLPSADISIQPPISRSLPEQPSASPPAIFFTSGTTSFPKPVLLYQPSLHVQSLAKISHLSLTASSIYLHLSPLFHVSGHSISHAISLIHATHVFPPENTHPSRPEDARLLLSLIAQHSVSVLVLLPAVLTLLLDAAPPDASFPTVDTLLYGGAPLPLQVSTQARSLFPNVRIIGAYGMTEAASSLTFLHHDNLPPDSPLHASAGWPPDHVDIRIDTSVLSSEDNEQGVGEILTRGPHVMGGYGARGKGLHRGWLRTGDLGFRDQANGALFLKGRRKDMIKSGGENVFAGEVEEVLLGAQDVEEAAVVGISHRVLGEAVAAVVILVTSLTRSETDILDDLMRTCQEYLSPFKWPKWIVRGQALPRTTTGKVQKAVVRQILERQLLRPIAKL